MVTERVVIEFRADGTRLITRDLRGISEESSKAAVSTEKLSDELRTLVPSATLRDASQLTDAFNLIARKQRDVIATTQGVTSAATRLAQVQQSLSGEVRKAAASQDRQIQASLAGARATRSVTSSAARLRAVQGELASTTKVAARQTSVLATQVVKLKRETDKTSDGVGGLSGSIRRLVGGITAAFIIRGLTRQFIRLSDASTVLSNSLRVVTDSTEELVNIQDALFQISKDTRSAVEGNAELFRRLSLSSKELGVSQSELLQVTKSINQAIKLSGATAQEASAGLIQLSQGLASGALRGDELRSVLEQLPAVADVIAKSLGKTRGELRQMGVEGKITAAVVLKAFREARGELSDKFGKTVPTIAESFVGLNNSLIRLVGGLNEVTGAAEGLKSVLSGIATVIDSLDPDNVIKLINIIRFGRKDFIELQADLNSLIEEQARARRLAAKENEGGNVQFQKTLTLLEKLGEEQDKLSAKSTAGILGISIEQLRAETGVMGEATAATLDQADALQNQVIARFKDIEGLKVRNALIQQLLGPERERAILERELTQLAGEGFDVEKLRVKLLEERVTAVDQLTAALDEEVKIAGLDAATAERRAAEIAALNALLEDGTALESARARAVLAGVDAQIQDLQLARERQRVEEEFGLSREQNAVREQALNEALASGNANFDQRRALQAELNDLTLQSTEGLKALGNEFLKIDTSAAALGVSIGQSLVGAIDNASAALAEFAVTGFQNVEDLREAFANFFQDLAKQILQAIIKLIILKTIQAATGVPTGGGVGGAGVDVAGGAAGGVVGGLLGLQTGGFVPAGQPVLVGERGPEPFVPTQSGRVLPNSSMGGGALPQVNLKVVNVKDEDEVAQELSENPQTEAAVMNVLRRNSREASQLLSR